jgi:ankyrin repeat protein
VKNVNLTELLLNSGADVNQKWYDWKPTEATTALEAAVRNGDSRIFDCLLRHGADPNDSGALYAAVSSCVELLEPLLNAFYKTYPHGQKAYGAEALGYVIRNGNLPLIEKLLAYRINSNDFGSKAAGFTPLGSAIRKDQGKDLALVEKLLVTGGNPNGITRKLSGDSTTSAIHYTALLTAIKTKSAAMVQLLISFGAEVNRPANIRVKRTPLQQAAEAGSYDITQILLDEGALVNAEPAVRGGATALQLAAIGGYIGIAELLLKRGAMVNAPPSKVNGRTALEGAAEHGRIDMLKLLLNAGAEIDGPGRRGYERALRLAEENGHIATRNYLESFSSTGSVDI